MFRFPIAPSLRTAAHPPVSILPRARTSTPWSQCSRFSSAPSQTTQRMRTLLSPTRTLPRPPRSIPSRPFTNSAVRFFLGSNKYNRFSGSNQPLWLQLLRNAKPIHFVYIGVAASGFYIYNLDTVEMTGRRRFNCVSHEQELKMGAQGYSEMLREYRGRILPETHPATIMVNRVLQRLIPLAPIEGANWRVHVIKDDDMKNAFVLPGGKVFVFTGILPICKDEDGLAAVLGHEIGHVVAHHTGERMSGHFVTMGVAIVMAFLFDISGYLPQLLLNLMYSLPNSRTQESEADNIGLMMMAKACYNPEAAVQFWARVENENKNDPPQFISTHPSNFNRKEAIRGWLHKAENVYEDSGCMGIGSFMPGFRQASDDMW